jgi:predicted DNA-binding ribbon-helix-helix protein
VRGSAAPNPNARATSSAQTRQRIAGSASHRRRGRIMKSPVVKRSIVVAGHKTSVSLEEAFWNGMKEISGLRDMTLSELVGEIDSNRQQGNLSSAIRLFVLDYLRNAPPPLPHRIQKRARPRIMVSIMDL